MCAGNYSFIYSFINICVLQFESRKSDYFKLIFIHALFIELSFQIALVISHGNASVESGFSINEDILVENIKERTIIAQRTIYDAIRKAGGSQSVCINQDMLSKYRMSHTNYRFYLEEARKDQEKVTNAAAEHKRKLDELNEMQAKRRRLEEELLLNTSDIASLKNKLKKN